VAVACSWDFLFAFGVHLNIVCTIAQIVCVPAAPCCDVRLALALACSLAIVFRRLRFSSASATLQPILRSLMVGRGCARSIIRDKIIASDRPMALLRTLPPLGAPPAVTTTGMSFAPSCMVRVMASLRTVPPLGVRRYRCG
jgi:hypothetical protein